MTTRQEQRRAMAAEAEAEIEETKRRSRTEGWTWELREAYLSAHHRLELARDLHYWSELERNDEAPVPTWIH